MGVKQRIRRVNEQLLPNYLMQPPAVFVLGINNFCNLHCRMCDVGTGNFETNFGANLVGANNRLMSLELCKLTLDQIADWAPQAEIAFVYTEPLAWPPIVQAVAYAVKLGLRTQITTNGLLLPRHAEALVNAGLHELTVSIDGPEKIHDFVRRKQGSYAKAIEGITKVRSFDTEIPISISCAVTQWNVGHFEQMIKDLSDHDITQVFISHNQFTDENVARVHNEKHPLLVTTPSNVFESDVNAINLEKLSQDLKQVKTMAAPFKITISPDTTDMDALEIYYHQPERYVAKRCLDPFRVMMVDADGEVIPAHGRCFRFPVGNVTDQPLKTLWNAPSLQVLRKELVKGGGLLPACARCCGGVT